MNREEQIVFEYLKRLHGEGVMFVPKHKDPPDIVIDSSIAVEVRRLNQHFFEGGKQEGLENLSFPLENAFKEVLNSLNYLYAGRSYWVSIHYRRPFRSSIRRARKDMELALKEFLDLGVTNPTDEIAVNSEISFLICASETGNGKLFSVAGSGDSDAGGWVIGVYAENIRHCISEKSLKIGKHLSKYPEWWLYLVDSMGFGLEQKEVLEVIKAVGNIGSFDRVVILNYDGKSVLATMSK